MRKIPNGKGIVRRKMPEGKKFFLASVPFLILVFAFAYVPLLGWAYAFFDYHP